MPRVRCAMVSFPLLSPVEIFAALIRVGGSVIEGSILFDAPRIADEALPKEIGASRWMVS
jgi:hypothetical protein